MVQKTVVQTRTQWSRTARFHGNTHHRTLWTHPKHLRTPVGKGLGSSSRCITSFSNGAWIQTRQCWNSLQFLPALWNRAIPQARTTEQLVHRLQDYKDIANTAFKSFLSTLRKAGCLFDSNTPKEACVMRNKLQIQDKGFSFVAEYLELHSWFSLASIYL